MLEQILGEDIQHVQINQKVEKKKHLQRVLNSFTYATKIFSAITDVEGNCTLTSEQGDCEYCQLIKASPSGLERCKRSYALGGEQALKWKEPYFFKCHAGLMSYVCPLSYKGNHIGNFVCGQVKMWRPDQLQSDWLRKLADENGQDPEMLLHSFNNVNMMSPVEVQSAADLALIITSYVAVSGAEIFDFHRKLRKVSSWIWTENKNQKDIDRTIEMYNSEQDMSELGNRIFAETRNSNITQAKKLLEELILQIFIQSKGQLEVIKGRSLEFLSLFTRMSTEYGVKFGEVFHLSDLKLKEIDEADTVEKASLWLLSVGNAFIDMISEKNAGSDNNIIDMVTDYIQKNYYSENISVQNIARACYMNPAYLGQLFKKSMGYTITEYIHNVRVEQAKRMLTETDQNTESIARQMGFKDRSYFCKIFKKTAGLSPGEYKKNNMLRLA